MYKYLSLLIIGLAISCAAPSSVQTPAGQIAWKADQVVNYLGVFQDAAIGAQGQGLLKTDDTSKIVRFVKSAVITIQQSPNGWKPTVTTALDELVKSLPTDVKDKFGVYIQLLRTMIASS